MRRETKVEELEKERRLSTFLGRRGDVNEDVLRLRENSSGLAQLLTNEKTHLDVAMTDPQRLMQALDDARQLKQDLPRHPNLEYPVRRAGDERLERDGIAKVLFDEVEVTWRTNGFKDLRETSVSFEEDSRGRGGTDLDEVGMR